jgi:hypothetical protein
MAETLTTTTDTHTVFVDRREQQCGKHEQAIEDLKERDKDKRDDIHAIYESLKASSEAIHATVIGIETMKNSMSNLSLAVEKESLRINGNCLDIERLRTAKLLNDGRNQQRKGSWESVREWLGWVFAAGSLAFSCFSRFPTGHK